MDAVSDSIRAYLGRRFGFHGLESTTDEIAAQLAKAKSLSIEPQEAVGFLGQCDLVKFAKASLADEASRDAHRGGLELVERTRPDAVRRRERRHDVGAKAHGPSAGWLAPRSSGSC